MDILASIVENDFTEDGEISAGFLFASIKNVGSSVAMVNGVSLQPGEAKSYPFVGKGYQEVYYQTNGSTLRIMTII